MKLFACPSCGLVVFFSNTHCERCETQLGYAPDPNRMIPLQAEGRKPWKYCNNFQSGVCNWLIPAEDPSELCRACRHNMTIPDLSVPENIALWRKLE